MPHISTLIEDIYELLGRKDGWFTPELATEFGNELSLKMQTRFAGARKPGLSLSQMGPRCPKALWHSVHTPELAEPHPPWAEMKFMYGDVIEALAITLAKAAGHTVAGEQDVLEVDGVPGHRDCVIDGYVVDVKSCGVYLYERFKTKSIAEDDSFGYLDQLDGYLVGSFSDPLVWRKDVAYDWAIDKTLGHMVLYEHHLREERIRDRIRYYKSIVALPKPPTCGCGTKPDGKSGNIKLDTRASYSSFKQVCFPLLRAFLYSDGPRYLTKVARLPDVPEISLRSRSINRA